MSRLSVQLHWINHDTGVEQMQVISDILVPEATPIRHKALRSLAQAVTRWADGYTSLGAVSQTERDKALLAAFRHFTEVRDAKRAVLTSTGGSDGSR